MQVICVDRNDLIACFNDTLEISNSEKFREITEKAKQSNRVYFANFVSNKHKNGFDADIIVEENTTFSAAKKYLEFGKTAVLNFANPEVAGGGVINGAMAQEECLCRSSNLYACINNSNVFNDYYAYHRSIRNYFYSDRLIYTKNVTVFKNDDEIPQIMSENEWFNVDVITCAAPYLGKQKYINQTVLKETFKCRIKNIFESAIDNDIEILILGAFGCGAFKNPPTLVAEAFDEVIMENNYKQCFKKIVFAIKKDASKDISENYWSFSNKFSPLYVNSPEVFLPGIPLPSSRIVKECSVGFSYMFTNYDVQKMVADGEGFAANTWDKQNKSNFEEQKKFLKWQTNNIYYKKQFSIVGDSISTLNGYNPNNYNMFYNDDNCAKSSVNDMKDTWWGKVIDFFGGELLVNDSWSGSRVTKLPNQDDLFPSGCSEKRTGNLHIGSVKPDVIIVYLGTNDWANSVSLWPEDLTHIDLERARLPIEMDKFEDAYMYMLGNLHQNYPNAEIWCCTLCETYMSNNTSFKFPHRYAGTHIDWYNDSIRKITKDWNCNLIDLYNSHIPYDTIDGTHPNESGMNTIATLVLREMADEQGKCLLDCEKEQHDFVVAEQYTGGTRYVCKKCGLERHTNTLGESFCNCCKKTLPATAKFCPSCGSKTNVKTNEPEVDRKGYVWDSSCMNFSEIASFHIEWGDLPIINISYDGDNLTLYNRINGSRDGGIQYPDGFFDEKKIELNDEQKIKIQEFLSAFDFTDWKTDDRTISMLKFPPPGFCITKAFSCKFENSIDFYCANPPEEQYDILVDFFKSFFKEEDCEILPMNEKTDTPLFTFGEKNCRRIEGPTPNGGEYAIIYYYDENGKSCSKDLAIKSVIQEFDSTGKMIYETFGNFDSKKVKHNIEPVYYDHVWYLCPHCNTSFEKHDVKITPFSKVSIICPTCKKDINDKTKIDVKKCEKGHFYDSAKYEQCPHCSNEFNKWFQDAEYVDLNKDATGILFDDTIKLFDKNEQKEIKIQKNKIDVGRIKELEIPIDIEAVSRRHASFLYENSRWYLIDHKSTNGTYINGQKIEPNKKYLLYQNDIIDFARSKSFVFAHTANFIEQEQVCLVDLHDEEIIDVGSVIDSRYKLVEMVGRGGVSKVYLATDTRLNNIYAVKLYDKNVKHFDVSVAIIMQEINLMKNLEHPSIPKVYDFVDLSNYFCVVQEYIKGNTLQSVLNNFGPQPEELVINWAKQLCDVLGYLHTRTPAIIYRDVKPQNIMLKPDGTITLIDFGVARTYKPGQLVDTVNLGTLGYAAPEQFGNAQTDVRTDVFGIGKTMHKLLTDTNLTDPPYETKPIRQYNPNLSQQLESIIIKCTAPNPRDRYQTCDELLQALTTYNQPQNKKGIFSKLFDKK